MPRGSAQAAGAVRLYARATLVVLALRVALPWVSLKRLLVRLTPHAPIQPRSDLVRRFPGLTRYIWILCRAGWPMQGCCLPVSLAAYHLARSMGMPVRCHCGIRRNGSRLEGHAWVTLNGRAFLKNLGGGEPYRIVFTVPDDLERGGGTGTCGPHEESGVKPI
ncbi:MAG: lasso peptide biosynthesis B2 protein [Acidobacteriota bacterium]